MKGKITFLGTGTSTGIPEIGCSCSTCVSTDVRDKRLRASILLSFGEKEDADAAHYVIDCGPDFREQMIRENVSSLEGIFLTHEHYDHVGGLDDIRPLFRGQTDCPLYTEEYLSTILKERMPYAFRAVAYPGVPHYSFTIIEPNVPFSLPKPKGIEILPLRVIHGKLPILGFKMGNAAYLTDVKVVPEETLEAIRGVEHLIIDGLRFYTHPTHFCVQEAIELGNSIGAKQIYLTHLAHTIGRHTEAEAVLKALDTRTHLAYDGMSFEVSF